MLVTIRSSVDLISVCTLVALNFTVNKLVFKYKSVESLIEGRPQILIRDGILFNDAMLETGITNEEINGAMRQHGCNDINQVHLAILETNGSISVLIKPTPA